MLSTYLTKQGIAGAGFALGLIVQMIRATPISNYTTVPQWMRPATAATSKQDKKAQQKSLTASQRQGYGQGVTTAKQMQATFGKNAAATTFAKNITHTWRTRETQVDAALAKQFGFTRKKSQSVLYYFISFSMPKVLIQAYMLDAIWNGVY